VAGSAAGGGYAPGGNAQLQDTVDQADQQIQTDQPLGGQGDIGSFFDSSSSEIGSYDYGGDPFSSDSGGDYSDGSWG
jgi:hypothetical protein